MDLPEGYVWVRAGAWRAAVLAKERDALEAAGVADPVSLAAKGTERFRGRGRPVRVPLGEAGSGVLRRYRHGGLLRGITRGLFLGPPRSRVELLATVAARRGGVRAPEILAAIHRRRAVLFHEGWLLTREVPDSRDLVAHLGAGGVAGSILTAVGRETRRMHEAGVWHADLHVKNVLVTADEGVVIIDFDRSRVRSPLSAEERNRNLLRFDRSLVKLGRRGIPVKATDRLRFFAGYFGGRPERAVRDRLAARCRRSLGWHRLWWGLSGS